MTSNISSLEWESFSFSGTIFGVCGKIFTGHEGQRCVVGLCAPIPAGIEDPAPFGGVRAADAAPGASAAVPLGLGIMERARNGVHTDR